MTSTMWSFLCWYTGVSTHSVLVLSLKLYRILILCHFIYLHKIDDRYYRTHVPSLSPVITQDSPSFPRETCFHKYLHYAMAHTPSGLAILLARMKENSQNSRQQRTIQSPTQFPTLATHFLLMWPHTTLLFNATFLSYWLIWSLLSIYKSFIFCWY